jgi:hypothetical protein
MMKKGNINRIVYLSGVLILASCSGHQNQEDPYADSRQIYQEAIDVHDEVMPRMDRIMQLKKLLKTAREDVTDDSLRTRIDSSISELEAAHDDMMQWMRNIQPVPEHDPNENPEAGENLPEPDEMEEIQTRSLAEIRNVQENFNESIQLAEKLLEFIKE